MTNNKNKSVIPAKPEPDTVSIAKLDFGEPGVNVQPGFYKLGLPDGGAVKFHGTFPCHDKTCEIKVSRNQAQRRKIYLRKEGVSRLAKIEKKLIIFANRKTENVNFLKWKLKLRACSGSGIFANHKKAKTRGISLISCDFSIFYDVF